MAPSWDAQLRDGLWERAPGSRNRPSYAAEDSAHAPYNLE
jgi:hypothetical protein